MESLISDLVEISKLESATLSVDNKTFQLDEILTPLINEYQVVAATEGINFSGLSTSLTVHSDKRLVRRIIQNFLTNAIHYSPLTQSGEGPKILLGCKRYGDYIQIQVWDNGPGIAEQQRDIIFKEFERLEQNREVPGLGLGLTISDRIAKLLGLRLGLKSIEGTGSMFYLEIPMMIQPVTDQVESNQSKLPDRKAKKDDPLRDLVLLIIDNDTLLLEALKQQLSQWSDHVIATTSGQEWFELSQSHGVQPDVIIADYHLDDGENGVAVAQLILSQTNQDRPVIICSADASEWLREAVSDADFSFIRKPIKSLALRKLIIKQLNSSSI